MWSFNLRGGAWAGRDGTGGTLESYREMETHGDNEISIKIQQLTDEDKYTHRKTNQTT